MGGATEGVAGMRHLRFGGNLGCGARTVRNLVEALSFTRTLTDVDLCDLDIPRPSLYDLVDCLPRATSITALDLSGAFRGHAFEGASRGAYFNDEWGSDHTCLERPHPPVSRP